MDLRGFWAQFSLWAQSAVPSGCMRNASDPRPWRRRLLCPTSSSPSEEIAVERSPASFGGGEATLSRTELLGMVKKHAHVVGWTVVEAEDECMRCENG
ncbi:hypothetical protein BRADI_1g55693v3 [Brachypodium distachyon]|uniref:Uncharacterized protein n=1 Tax=Brachypodium distachyon TaxID=15368 RepID=A0A0Q3HCQ8_BRADI|nr:hypothetical protein BRADI_1g55693v3 [Brachypodium distachyon]